MNFWEVLLILKLDDIRAIFFFSFVMLVVAIIPVLITTFDTCIEKSKKPVIAMLAVIVVSGVMTALIPSTKQIAIATILPELIANKQIRNIPPKLLQYLEKELDAKLKEGSS